MPNVAVLDVTGRQVGEITLSESVFGIQPNTSVMHDVVVNYLANQRQGTQSALTRAEVRGGGKKPWRQKGTGHARQGSIRSPQWKHGGIVFAPKPREYRYTLNKKVRRLAIKSAFSSKFIDNNILVLDSLPMEEFKTKTVINMLTALNSVDKTLIILPEVDKKIIVSSRNIPGIKTAQVNEINVYDLINSKKVIILKEAVEKIGEVYA